MKILCITHADFETPGVIENWANDKGYSFTICQPYKGEDCLNTSEFDFLIIMGGPQSPLKLEEFPYLRDEIKLAKTATSQGKIVLGFCLGAQIIGEALGAKTEISPEKEVGVYDITLTEDGQNDPLFVEFSRKFPVVHWHNDMPGETKDSKLLAFSAGCPKQVIRYLPKVYGFQCHLEITSEGIKKMIEACPEDLALSKFTQAKEELLTNDYNIINEYMFKILDRLVNDVPHYRR
jgi:GMP synthase (glutamine-hydrolysing)